MEYNYLEKFMNLVYNRITYNRGIFMPRYNITVKGRVQGVGFRYFVQATAKQMKLTGWVKNLNNGDVELEAQSDTDFLNILVDKLEKGNSFSKMTDIEINNINDPLNERDFRVTY